MELQGQECLESPISNIEEGWDYTGDGTRNIKFEYGYSQTRTNGGKKTPLKESFLSVRAKGQREEGVRMDWEEKTLKNEEEMRVKGCHLSSCPPQSLPDYFPL